VHTDAGKDHGKDTCLSCGATDITFNPNTGQLRCDFCRTEFVPQSVSGFETDVSRLQGKVVGAGATDVAADSDAIITLACGGCGAEVIIDTDEVAQARCHWCRNTLSLNTQVPNGAVPDAVLPFSVKKEDAQRQIEQFVAKRRFFAYPKFKQEFCTENILGVYLPYMVVDVNAHAQLTGQGEVETRRYTVGSGNSQQTRYDANLFNVSRNFDVAVKGLTVESSADKLDHGSSSRTNNIINAIMPFDTENCVRWNANFLKGFASEKRDVNIEGLKGLVGTKAKDIARHSANTTLTAYNRGVAWSNERLEIKGQQWKAAYLPVWLYSYQQVKSPTNKVLHYVAVNARTQNTMGSVPIHMPKLLAVSALVSLLGLLLAFFLLVPLALGLFIEELEILWALPVIGPLYFFYYFNKYRNAGARHLHEENTNTAMSNMQVVDDFVKERKGLSNATMKGANNFDVRANTGNQPAIAKVGNWIKNV